MKKLEKKNWKAPAVQDLSIKEITLSGTEPAHDESGGQVEYTPRRYPPAS